MYDRLPVMDMLRGVGGALAHARLPLVALALALHVIGLVVTGERWRVVVAALGSRLRLSRTTLINLAGIFVRNATPTTGLGGDASRIALLRAEGVPLAQATASFAYVRLSEVPPLAVVVALSTPAVAGLVRRSHTALVVTGAVIVVGITIAWLSRHRLRAHVASIWTRTGHLAARGGSPPAFGRRCIPSGGVVPPSNIPDILGRRALPAGRIATLGATADFHHGLLGIGPAPAALAVFYATLAQVETIARQIVVAAAFGVPLTIQQSATITAMGIAGGFVPTVGSIGAIDGSMVAGLMLFGATVETAVAVTIVGRAISYGVSTAAGAVALGLLGGRGILRAVTKLRLKPPSDDERRYANLRY